MEQRCSLRLDAYVTMTDSPPWPHKKLPIALLIASWRSELKRAIVIRYLRLVVDVIVQIVNINQVFPVDDKCADSVEVKDILVAELVGE